MKQILNYRRCSKCHKWLPLEYFGTHSHRCKICNRDADWKRRYNITPDEYFEMYQKQEGKCAICHHSTSKLLCIDHNHTTGQVRGLLCEACNYALGHFEKRPIDKILKYFLDYLKDRDNAYNNN